MITVKINSMVAHSSYMVVQKLRSAGIPLSAAPPYLPLRGILFRTLDDSKSAVIYRWSDDHEELPLIRRNTPKLDDYDNQVSNLAEDAPRGGGWIVLVAAGILSAGVALLALLSNLIARAVQ